MAEFIVKHRGKEHDVSGFLRYHPGGSNTLRSYAGCDITEQLAKTHHAPSAYQLLKDYELDKGKNETSESDIEVKIGKCWRSIAQYWLLIDRIWTYAVCYRNW